MKSFTSQRHGDEKQAMITEALYKELHKITEKERSLLVGNQGIQKHLYMSGDSDVIDGVEILLKEGELLFLNQNATQEIYPTEENDIAVNFIILPEFFDYGLKLMGDEQNLLRQFVIDCLTGKNDAAGYMHFKVADVLPIQNLVENLIWSIWNKQPNKRSINQVTMGLLFLQLLNHMDRMEAGEANQSQKLVIDVLGYIEEHYKDGELTQLAQLLNYDTYWLSKEIKKRTGKNYTELVQAKRLNQAVYLLENTSMSVLDIGLAVGYDNQSYFHRIFQKRFQMSPKKYRDAWVIKELAKQLTELYGKGLVRFKPC